MIIRRTEKNKKYRIVVGSQKIAAVIFRFV